MECVFGLQVAADGVFGRGRILAATPVGTRTLVVAGNAHTPTAPTGLGVPMGAWLTLQRPEVRELRIQYGGGRYYNMQPRRFGSLGPRARQIRLRRRPGALVLDLPAAQEATVPQRSWQWPPPAHAAP